jgi:hypothetical protein
MLQPSLSGELCTTHFFPLLALYALMLILKGHMYKLGRDADWSCDFPMMRAATARAGGRSITRQQPLDPGSEMMAQNALSLQFSSLRLH